MQNNYCKITPIILAGGTGTRLWPLSRDMFPKQFLSFNSVDSLLQKTLQRSSNLNMTSPILICNEEHRFLVAEQLNAGGYQGDIILEPEGRNTAPAIALAALEAVSKDSDSLLLVMPADHVVDDELSFQKTIQGAINYVQEQYLVTFGIKPTFPATGYGYIKQGECLTDIANKNPAYLIDQFVEKPAAEKAQQYLDNGDYLWNSGMFLFSASTYLSVLQQLAPRIYSACYEAFKGKTRDVDFIRVDKDKFLSSPADSIDYAIMEKADKRLVIPLDVGWNDIGSWDSVWKICEKDVNGNHVYGDVHSIDTTDSLLMSTSRLVSTIGVDNLIVVETDDAILVADKKNSETIKQLITELKNKGREEVNIHKQVHRPWGMYHSIDSGNGYQVKRIIVKPQGKLSLQMHHHRAEHWVIISGTGLVTIDGKTQLLTVNQSVYIPLKAVHSLENPGKDELELIEVQTGTYLGEDDIVRFDDVYGRIDEKNS